MVIIIIMVLMYSSDILEAARVLIGPALNAKWQRDEAAVRHVVCDECCCVVRVLVLVAVPIAVEGICSLSPSDGSHRI